MTDAAEPRYRLEFRIATGGMGVVWRATDTVLGREVAVKVLKPEYADDPEFRTRFEGEARHAAALHHPGVASVFDFGELPAEDGSEHPRPYLVMELVPGQPLSALLRSGEPMPPEPAADLAAQAADAIAAAHKLGIVHRDIKPANLMVTPDRRVKITDFGIARAADAAGITQTGQVVGTPAYLSPEQAEGRPSTAATDIYALGVVLYECLAGVRPFQRDTPVSTALAHLRDEPPPLPDSVPRQLRETVAVALSKDPADRFDSMDSFAAALRGAPVRPGAGAASAAGGAAAAGVHDGVDDGATRVLAATPPPSTPPDTRRDRARRPAWLPWAAAAVAVLLLVLLIAWLSRGDEGGEPTSDGTDDTTSETARPRESTTRETPSPEEEPTSAAPEEPATVEVVAEDYIGMSKDEAKARLEAIGLKVKEEKVENDGSLEEDTVTDVVPAGTLEEGDEVTIFVADKPPDVEELPEELPGEAPGQSGQAPGQAGQDQGTED